MFHMGGDYWKDWNDRLHPLLVNRSSGRARWPAVGTPATPSPTAGPRTPAGCT